jgi:hypothetical protein
MDSLAHHSQGEILFGHMMEIGTGQLASQESD